MGKCVVNEVWFSTRRRLDDATFVIKEIDAEGNFRGTHGGDPISGKCKGNTIEYVREGSEKLWYSGQYQDDKNLVGVVSPLPGVTKRLFLPVDDDWVGTRT